jgi:molybdopterin synthase catalytic subunit
MSYLTREPIDVTEWRRGAADGRAGASVEFLGIVRGEEEAHPIAGLDYEAYEPMAERLIGQLIERAKQRWPLLDVTVVHRLGRVAVGEAAVFIGVRAPHREEAFEACRFLIDELKRDVPIWKVAVHGAACVR